MACIIYIYDFLKTMFFIFFYRGRSNTRTRDRSAVRRDLGLYAGDGKQSRKHTCASCTRSRADPCAYCQLNYSCWCPYEQGNSEFRRMPIAIETKWRGWIWQSHRRRLVGDGAKHWRSQGAGLQAAGTSRTEAVFTSLQTFKNFTRFLVTSNF